MSSLRPLPHVLPLVTWELRLIPIWLENFFLGVIESNKVSTELPFLQTERPQLLPHETCAPDASPALLSFSELAPVSLLE